jgi:uncharacterized protein YndB with AHSA1/START domain
MVARRRTVRAGSGRARRTGVARRADRRDDDVALAVVEVDPPKRFSFRWCFADPDCSGPSLLVTFDLVPTSTGTRIRMRETGFREMGWEVAVLEEQYREHESSWDHYMPALGTYVARRVSSS